MDLLILLLIIVTMVFIAVFAYRQQKQKHQKLAQKITSQLETPALVSDPRAVYFGLASRGILQPHELLAVLVISTEVIHLVVPPVGMMSPIDLTIKISDINALTYSNAFLYPGTRYPGMLMLTFGQGGSQEEVAIRPTDRELTMQTLEKLTGLTFCER